MFVLVTGCFNVLHPGHIRLFKFARTLGQKLVVAVESDRLAGAAGHISQHLRLEGVRSCVLVDDAFIFEEPISELIYKLRPCFVVKGREYEKKFNPEAEVLESYGGRLVFSSGEIQFSSADLIRFEVSEKASLPIKLPLSYMARHGIDVEKLLSIVNSFKKLNVLTVGDLIVDDYITCEPLGMSQEDPTLVVTPIDRERFLGGAGIVAAHAQGLGAKCSLISVVGQDSAKEFCTKTLEQEGVNYDLLVDTTRTTTVKERFRSQGKTLLRVSHLQQSSISIELQEKLIKKAMTLLVGCDLLLFSDFNYGVLPQALVDKLIEVARENKIIIAADSQTSSQVGDVSRFRGVDLLMPTEREARVSLQSREEGLVVLAEQLRQKADGRNILLKLGADGVLIHAPDYKSDGWLTDQVDALNKFPKDVAGAGDSMLVGSALALAAGSSIWEAACVGSIVAAVQVGRIGNLPVNASLLNQIIDQ